MPIYPPREPNVDPASHRAGRLGVLLLVLATVTAVVIVGYVVYRALMGR